MSRKEKLRRIRRALLGAIPAAVAAVAVYLLSVTADVNWNLPLFSGWPAYAENGYGGGGSAGPGGPGSQPAPLGIPGLDQVPFGSLPKTPGSVPPMPLPTGGPSEGPTEGPTEEPPSSPPETGGDCTNKKGGLCAGYQWALDLNDPSNRAYYAGKCAGTSRGGRYIEGGGWCYENTYYYQADTLCCCSNGDSDQCTESTQDEKFIRVLNIHDLYYADAEECRKDIKELLKLAKAYAAAVKSAVGTKTAAADRQIDEAYKKLPPLYLGLDDADADQMRKGLQAGAEAVAKTIETDPTSAGVSGQELLQRIHDFLQNCSYCQDEDWYAELNNGMLEIAGELKSVEEARMAYAKLGQRIITHDEGWQARADILFAQKAELTAKVEADFQNFKAYAAKAYEAWDKAMTAYGGLGAGATAASAGYLPWQRELLFQILNDAKLWQNNVETLEGHLKKLQRASSAEEFARALDNYLGLSQILASSTQALDAKMAKFLGTASMVTEIYASGLTLYMGGFAPTFLGRLVLTGASRAALGAAGEGMSCLPVSPQNVVFNFTIGGVEALAPGVGNVAGSAAKQVVLRWTMKIWTRSLSRLAGKSAMFFIRSATTGAIMVSVRPILEGRSWDEIRSSMGQGVALGVALDAIVVAVTGKSLAMRFSTLR